MRLSTTFAWMAVLSVALLSNAAWADDADELKSPAAKTSYSIGAQMARTFKQQGIDIDMEVFFKGFADVMGDEELLLSDEEINKTLMAFEKEAREKQMEKAKASAEKNMKDGAAFLAENKKKEGVVTLPSGLQYKILKKGEGKKPTDDDQVVCDYRGTLIDGTEFDSSYKRGEPATFPVTGVIRGWTEALKLMPVGSKWQLFVPSNLAYGGKTTGNIGPNSTLIFEVELRAIK